MAKAIKTNVLRHLDALKIPYETREYTVDDEISTASSSPRRSICPQR